MYEQATTVQSHQGQVSHLLCTCAIGWPSFVQQIVDSSWISANWQLNVTFPEWSGNLSAWIFFINTGAGNERVAAQCSCNSCAVLQRAKDFQIPSHSPLTTSLRHRDHSLTLNLQTRKLSVWGDMWLASTVRTWANQSNRKCLLFIS